MDPRIDPKISIDSLPLEFKPVEILNQQCLELSWKADGVSQQIFEGIGEDAFNFDSFSLTVDLNDEKIHLLQEVKEEIKLDLKENRILQTTNEKNINNFIQDSDQIVNIFESKLEGIQIFHQALQHNYIFDDRLEMISILDFTDFELIDLSKRGRIDLEKLELVVPRNHPFFKEGEVTVKLGQQLTIRYETTEEEEEFSKAWEGFVEITNANKTEVKEEKEEEEKVAPKKKRTVFREKSYEFRSSGDPGVIKKDVNGLVANKVASNINEELNKIEEKREKKNILNEELEKEVRHQEIKHKSINSHIREMDFQLRSKNARDERLQELNSDFNKPVPSLLTQHKAFKFPSRKVTR